MSRKATITQKEIVNAAFKITKREGFEQITSRKLAAAAGCSTQPIFRIYENMDALKKDVYDKAAVYYEDYYNDYTKSHEVPFVDLGLAYIGFAQKYPHLFRLLFISEQGPESKSMYDLVNGSNENVVKEINKAVAKGAGNAQDLFMKMWIFIHGIACMVLKNDFDMSEKEIEELLVATYIAFSGA